MADIRLSRTIKADKGAIYKALTQQQALSQWFSPRVITTPVAGTYAAFSFDEELHFKMHLKEISPKKIVWEYAGGNVHWNGSMITFRLAETGKRTTLLKFSQSGLLENEKLNTWKNSWGHFLDQLKHHVEEDESYVE